MGVTVTRLERQTVVLVLINTGQELLGIFCTIEDGINGNIATRSLFYEGISKLDLLSTTRHRRTDNGCKNDSSEYIVKFHCIYLFLYILNV